MAGFEFKTNIKIDLNKTPKWARLLIVFLLPVAAGIAFYIMDYEPKSKQLDRLLAEIGEQENKIRTNETKAGKLEVLKAENEWLKAKLKELQEKLPEEREVSGLLRQISDRGMASGLDILEWKPESKRAGSSGLYDEIPVSVRVLGGFHNLGEFFSGISSMTRIVNVSGIKITGSKGATDKHERLNVAFTATAFTSIAAQKTVDASGAGASAAPQAKQ
ncbi:MAG: type 4a pilus biogenesis protein PilO [Nitrospirae bacterium]|nr:type 4a pilus biogenesis protein PilO [Nitrospirota bacterium]